MNVAIKFCALAVLRRVAQTDRQAAWTCPPSPLLLLRRRWLLTVFKSEMMERKSFFDSFIYEQEGMFLSLECPMISWYGFKKKVLSHIKGKKEKIKPMESSEVLVHIPPLIHTTEPFGLHNSTCLLVTANCLISVSTDIDTKPRASSVCKVSASLLQK